MFMLLSSISLLFLDFLDNVFLFLENHHIGKAACVVKYELFIRVDFCATNAYCLLHPSNAVQDALLEASIPDELSSPEEMEQQV